MRFLIIGSGIAGLSFALRVAEFGEVVVVTKKGVVDSATNLAQGGIAAVLDKEKDSVDSHINDTLSAGGGLCDYDIVRDVVQSGYKRIQDLVTYGVEFVMENDGKSLSLGQEGGHSHRRIAHAYDLTGRAIEMTLLKQAKANKAITLLEDHMLVDLIVTIKNQKPYCTGA